MSYTCETAYHFFLYQVAPRWEEYHSVIKSLQNKVLYLLSGGGGVRYLLSGGGGEVGGQMSIFRGWEVVGLDAGRDDTFGELGEKSL